LPPGRGDERGGVDRLAGRVGPRDEVARVEPADPPERTQETPAPEDEHGTGAAAQPEAAEETLGRHAFGGDAVVDDRIGDIPDLVARALEPVAEIGLVVHEVDAAERAETGREAA